MSYVFVTFALVDLFRYYRQETLPGTDVLLIDIISYVYCCMELSIITNILQHI